MKSLFKSLSIALLAISVFAMPGFASDKIKIGCAGVISGDLTPYGMSALRGAQFAVEDLNANGGILGKQRPGIGGSKGDGLRAIPIGIRSADRRHPTAVDCDDQIRVAAVSPGHLRVGVVHIADIVI